MINEAVDSVAGFRPLRRKGVGRERHVRGCRRPSQRDRDAVGVRLTSLPLTPESVYRALCAARGEPLEE